MNKKKNAFLLYIDTLAVIDSLTDVQCASLFRAIYHYHHDQIMPEMDHLTKTLFIMFKTKFDVDDASYTQKIEEKSNAGKLGNLKRWNKKLYDLVVKNGLSLEDAYKIHETKISEETYIKYGIDRKVSHSDEEIAKVANEDSIATDPLPIPIPIPIPIHDPLTISVTDPDSVPPKSPLSASDSSTESSTSVDLSSNAVPHSVDISWIPITEEDIAVINENLQDKHTKGKISRQQVEDTITSLVANEVIIRGYYPPEVVNLILLYALRRQNPTKLKKATCTSIDTPLKWQRFKNDLLKCENGNLPNSLQQSIEKSYGMLVPNTDTPDSKCLRFKQQYEEEMRKQNLSDDEKPCSEKEFQQNMELLQEKLKRKTFNESHQLIAKTMKIDILEVENE